MKLEQLAGTWYIHFTDFPLWLKGDKTHPTFTYTLKEKAGKMGLEDEVKYLKKGKVKRILGFDSAVDESNRKFIWRGKGVLALLSSRWEIMFYTPEEAWAIIHFQKTLFTPEGYDVISRDPLLSLSQIKNVQGKLSEWGLENRLQSLNQQ